MDGAQRPSVRQWLSAARHPARRDGLIAAALLVLPWALAWALAPHHHLDATVVAILVSATIPLATLWLTFAALRDAGEPPTARDQLPAWSCIPRAGESPGSRCGWLTRRRCWPGGRTCSAS